MPSTEAAKAQKLVIRKPTDVEVHGEFVAEMARQQVYAQYGEEAYSTGMKVITTFAISRPAGRLQSPAPHPHRA